VAACPAAHPAAPERPAVGPWSGRDRRMPAGAGACLCES